MIIIIIRNRITTDRTDYYDSSLSVHTICDVLMKFSFRLFGWVDFRCKLFSTSYLKDALSYYIMLHCRFGNRTDDSFILGSVSSDS